MAAAMSVAPAIPQDEENFAEDECTMDFGDEITSDQGFPRTAPPVNGYLTLQQRHLMFSLIPGDEDFSRYLADDDDDKQHTPYPNPEPIISAHKTSPSPARRYRKRGEDIPISPTAQTRRKASASPPAALARRGSPVGAAVVGEVSGSGSSERRSSTFTLTPTSMMAPAGPMTSTNSTLDQDDINQTKSVSSVRQLFGRILQKTTRRSRDRRPKTSQAGGSIHDFSFADSKMAIEFLNRGGNQSPTSGSSMLETRSDLGAYQTSGRPGSSWWDVGTLSSARSVPLSYSSGSSVTGSTFSKRDRKGSRADESATGKSLLRIFQRNRKSHSVPDLPSTGNDEADASSVLSGASSGGGRSGPARKASDIATKPAASSRLAMTESSSAPPPLPPLRKSVEDGASETRRTRSAARFRDFFKKITTTQPSPDTSSGKGQGQSAETAGAVPRRNNENISTLRYVRRNDEIPVAF